ncbi:uncharacterized protein MONBRDRAFT_36649 [Monosiga brevicollis MX1]|uniref:MaoC-like domain-containing protein n=1 Tax=Monosiga brevicollis TaxID=81824 RepID=A9UWL2_MONBE|nr:uncharacterized protein MONBRDRAFT_36649 [Monosiga brevicollis MX1]EDQ90064.1 predicted protein [Monosiga brevicollis MX1]|eukprot:XP_001744831.1 hypothetical protein [Monosiga brevicollis MX1]
MLKGLRQVASALAMPSRSAVLARGLATKMPEMPTCLHVGQSIETTRSFSPEDVQAFAELSGDFNPLHLDADFAAKTRFGRPIVHGVLINGLLSGIMGAQLPGAGSIFLSQTLSFSAPLFVGEPVTVRATVDKFHPTKPVVELKTISLDKDGQQLMAGTAVVMIRPELYAASMDAAKSK